MPGFERPHRISAPSVSAGDAVADAPAWSPDGRSLAFATWDGNVRILTLATGDARTLTRLPDAEISDLAWSSDGHRPRLRGSRAARGLTPAAFELTQ